MTLTHYFTDFFHVPLIMLSLPVNRYRVSLPEVNRSERHVDHSLPSSAEVANVWSYPFIPLCAFKACTTSSFPSPDKQTNCGFDNYLINRQTVGLTTNFNSYEMKNWKDGTIYEKQFPFFLQKYGNNMARKSILLPVHPSYQI